MNPPISCPVKKNAARSPGQIAISDSEQSLTYEQFDDSVATAVRNIADFGIEPGDVVAVLGRNSSAYAALLFAALRSGFVLMPLNTRLTEDDWSRHIALADCRLVVYESEFYKNNSKRGGLTGRCKKCS